MDTRKLSSVAIVAAALAGAQRVQADRVFYSTGTGNPFCDYAFTEGGGASLLLCVSTGLASAAGPEGLLVFGCVGAIVLVGCLISECISRAREATEKKQVSSGKVKINEANPTDNKHLFPLFPVAPIRTNLPVENDRHSTDNKPVVPAEANRSNISIQNDRRSTLRPRRRR